MKTILSTWAILVSYMTKQSKILPIKIKLNDCFFVKVMSCNVIWNNFGTNRSEHFKLFSDGGVLFLNVTFVTDDFSACIAGGRWAKRSSFAGICKQTGPSKRPDSQRAYRQTWLTSSSQQNRKSFEQKHCSKPWSSSRCWIASWFLSVFTVAHWVNLRHPGHWAVWRTGLAIQGVVQELMSDWLNWKVRLSMAGPQNQHQCSQKRMTLVDFIIKHLWVFLSHQNYYFISLFSLNFSLCPFLY